MPRQNRVTPFGEIIATPERGTFMGNRGVLHDTGGQIKRVSQVKRWIVCVLDFRGRKRVVMAPNRYTELFFLDEATALAAGHRPCAECRHSCFVNFRNAWSRAHSKANSVRPTAEEIDRQLHAERINRDCSKRSFTTALSSLPDGVLVTVPAWGQHAYLVLGNSMLEWSSAGYRNCRPRPNNEKAHVLTPTSTVEVIRAGYAPAIHGSVAGRFPNCCTST